MSVKTSATLALFGTVIIWSLFAVIARVTVAKVSPMVLLFLRFGIACIAFSPFLVKYKPWSKKNFGRLVVISLFSTINVAFFILGIQFTSASASQLIYAAMPILIIVYHLLFQKMRYPRAKILGVIIGFSGILYIVYLSSIEKGTTISGSLIGNICIVGAMMGWMTYLLMSKKLTARFTPVEIGSVSILVSFAVSGILALFEIITKRAFFELTLPIVLAALYMGVFATFIAYILFQYAVKHTSALTVSLTSYIQPIVTTVFATLFIGERLTAHFLFGSILVFLGIFLTTTYEAYVKHKMNKEFVESVERF